jgi:membrane protein YdbS with pleckstrin-like domain
MKFPSKIDGWMIPVMVVSVAGMLVALIAVMVTATPWPVRALVAGVLVVVMFLLFSVFRSTYYEVLDSELRVVSGPFRWTIPLSAITDIQPTRNPLSSPALSLDRLKVSYGKRKFVLVSPADKDGFTRAVREASQRHE